MSWLKVMPGDTESDLVDVFASSANLLNVLVRHSVHWFAIVRIKR